MVHYSTKELIDELLTFMKRRKKRHLLLVEYVEETSGIIPWTKTRKRALYKAVHETNELFRDYCYRKNEEKLQLFVRVNRI